MYDLYYGTREEIDSDLQKLLLTINMKGIKL